MSKKDVIELIKKSDTDNNGFVDYSEFLSAFINTTNLMCKENVRKVFDILDRDGNN